MAPTGGSRALSPVGFVLMSYLSALQLTGLAKLDSRLLCSTGSVGTEQGEGDTGRWPKTPVTMVPSDGHPFVSSYDDVSPIPSGLSCSPVHTSTHEAASATVLGRTKEQA
jgi:hypothetical protein